MFRLLFERSADAIWLFDPQEAVFVDCNDAAVALMRIGSKEKLLRTHPADLAPASQLDGRSSREVAAEVSALVERNGAHRFEWLGRRADGTTIPVEVIATAIQAGGKSLHVVVSRDISARKEMEDALRESEQLLTSIADNIAEAIYRTSPEHGLVYVNPAYLRLFGYGSLEEVMSVPRERLYANPQDRPALIEQLATVGRFVREVEFVRKDGGHFWGLIQSVAIRDGEAGAMLYNVGSISDITGRKRMEEELRQLNATLERRIAERTAELTESEARMRTLVEHAPEAIVVFDGETGRFLSCNENASRLYGLSRERLTTVGPWDVSPELQPDGRSSAEAARAWIEKALTGETPVFDWMHRHAGGRLVPCEVRLVALPGEGRRLIRGSVTDNTERRRRESIQRATYQISEAVHAAEDLDSLYSRIHEIIKGLMPAENFYLALFDPGTELISFPYFVDERSERPTPFKLGTGLTGHVLRTGKPLLVDAAMNARQKRVGDTVTFEGFEEIRYVESGTPAAIWLGVPLSLEGRPFGVMAVQDYRDANAYGEEEKQILSFVAAQTALAIDRKLAAQALVRRSEQVRRHRNALLELALLDKADFAAALETICSRSAGALEVARVSYWTFQEGGAELVCEMLFRRAEGGLDPAAKGARLAKGEYPCYFAALATSEPIAASHVESHPETRELVEGYLRPLGITSMLDVPVWLHGRLMGVLCHEHTGEAREWSPEEIDFASSVANMVTLSIEAAQRARSEQGLRESEQKFRALFEATSQGVMLHDEEKFLEVNPAAVRILECDHADQLVGKSPVETSPALQPDGQSSALLARKHIADCLANGSARFEWVSLSPHGKPIPIEVILTRIEMSGRQIIQAVINDISDRKKAEAELLRALAREKELSALKSNFVSMVSHEFRTPLGIIMSSAEILGDYLEKLEPEERQSHLRSIARSAMRMSELMEEVLVLGRLDAGKMDFKPEALDLRSLCLRLVDEVHSATDRACPVELLLGDIPASAQGDERLLRHIFLNLLTNAIKYSEPGRPVHFEVQREGGDAVCRISDHGIGIPEADQSWLFSAFHRGCNVGQRPGTGLGLVIVKRCVELHGGRIRVESKLGEGTTMIVRVPLFH
jgi:PAS domain S-box-containing protein